MEKIVVSYTDDLTGRPYESGETVQFAVDGKEFEIDLSDTNAKKLRAAFEKYASAGRRVQNKRPTRKYGRAPKGQTAAVREWARAAGFEVGTKGRIPAPVQEAYDKANA